MQKSTLDYYHLKPRASALRCGVIFLIAACAGLSSPESAQAFDCGSTGANGAMNVTSNVTLQLPPDGIFNCTTITVAQGATLTFSNNVMNTPVYLLATGDVLINGSIDVGGAIVFGLTSDPGQAGPGGYNGGFGGINYFGQDKGGDGLGPGGGKANGQYGAYATAGYGGNTNTYGSLLLTPLIGGSGAGGSDGTPGLGGAGGGGAILIASNTKVNISGSVNAVGGMQNYRYPGSGGAIRVVAPVVSGNGTLNADAGSWNSAQAGKGRVRIDCMDSQAYLQLLTIGITSRGSHMIVFPTNAPVLDIIGVAEIAIPQGTNSPVFFELPTGGNTNQPVVVQAWNFTKDVPIRVVVTPRNAPSVAFDATILQSSGNPPFAVVPVIIPAGSICEINAWTR